MWWLAPPRMSYGTIASAAMANQSTINNSAPAQTYPLAEAPLAKSCFRIELTMELAGTVRLQQEGKTIKLNQTAAARHIFLERIIDAKDGLAEKTARLYRTAEATITVDQ